MFVRGRSSEVKEIQETLRRAVIGDCSTKTSLVKCWCCVDKECGLPCQGH